jgi:adenosine kinase
MPILVSGSIAVDHIMVFRDRFQNHIQPDKIHVLNVSFHVPQLRRSWGGCGANIAFHLKQLGEEPILLGTVGSEFDEYAAWLDRHGVSRAYVRVLDDAHTACCFITTDLDDNQITAFHPGAMDRAHEAPVEAVREPFEWAIVSPNGKQGMIQNARALKARGVRTVIDPGQGIPIFEPAELREFLTGAAVFVVNDYEWSLVLAKTGLVPERVTERAGAVIVTLGEKGARILSGGEEIEVPPVGARRVEDPTGAGDAFRAGLLFGCARGLPLETAARVGSVLGSMKVECQGPQGLATDLATVRARYREAYGSELA